MPEDVPSDSRNRPVEMACKLHEKVPARAALCADPRNKDGRVAQQSRQGAGTALAGQAADRAAWAGASGAASTQEARVGARHVGGKAGGNGLAAGRDRRLHGRAFGVRRAHNHEGGLARTCRQPDCGQSAPKPRYGFSVMADTAYARSGPSHVRA